MSIHSMDLKERKSGGNKMGYLEEVVKLLSDDLLAGIGGEKDG